MLLTTTTREALLALLARVKTDAVQKKRSPEEHQRVRLTQQKHQLFCKTATDTVQIESSLQTIAFTDEGVVIVSYAELAKALKAYKGTQIILRADAEKLHLSSDCDEYTCFPCFGTFPEPFVAHIFQGETYSEELTIGLHEKLTLTYEVLTTWKQQIQGYRAHLTDLLDAVVVAASNDLSRPVFAGVQLHLENNELKATAADSFRLSTQTRTFKNAGSWPHPLLIPAKPLIQALHAFPPATSFTLEAIVTTQQRIAYNNQPIIDRGSEQPSKDRPFIKIEEILLSAEGTTFTLCPIFATFPQVESVIPQSGTTRVFCETRAFLQALKTFTPYKKAYANRIGVTLDTTHIMLNVAPDETIPTPPELVEAQYIPATITGPSLAIVLNYQYLLEILSATSFPEFSLELTIPTRPALIRPVSPTEEGYRYAIMPMLSRQ